MLVATGYNEYGIDFIYTDTTDYEDPMQARTQNIPDASIQRNFAEITATNAAHQPDNETAQAAKNMAAKAELGLSKGTAKSVGVGNMGFALALVSLLRFAISEFLK